MFPSKPRFRPYALVARCRARQLKLMQASSDDLFMKFWRLDTRIRPGLSAADFYRMFTRCRCGLIMTRHAFRWHPCQFTIIELTSSEDEEKGNIENVACEQVDD